jgi:type II secretory pathway component PulF
MTSDDESSLMMILNHENKYEKKQYTDELMVLLQPCTQVVLGSFVG